MLRKLFNKYIWYTSDCKKRYYDPESFGKEFRKIAKLQKIYYNIESFIRNVIDFPRDLCYNIKYAYQRVTRGWSDRDVWSIDIHLANIIPEMLRHLKKTKYGYPSTFLKNFLKNPNCYDDEDEAIKKWDEVLDTVAYTFDTYKLILAGDLIIAKTKKQKKNAQVFCNRLSMSIGYTCNLMTDEEIKRYELGWKYFNKYFEYFGD
jgi:hypothetical protein